jgi:hypothetical protein
MPDDDGPWPLPEHERLLDAALAPPDRAAAAWRTWRAGCGAADFGSVDWVTTRLFAPVARHLDGRVADDDWLGRMKGICRHMWVPSRVRRRELAPVLAALADLPSPAILLKGEALIAGGHVPDDGSRTMGDSDVLVREEDLDRAEQILRDLGWQPVSQRGRRDAKRHAHVFRNATGRELDLHRWLLPLPARLMTYDLMAAHAVSGTQGGVAVRVPHATELLLHVLVASRRQVEPGPPPFLWVADAVALLHAPIEWPRLVEEARRHEQVLATRQGLRYLTARFGARVPPEVQAELDTLPVTARERRVRYRMAALRPLSASPRRLWLDACDDYSARCEAQGARPTRRGLARHLVDRAARRGPRHVGRLLRGARTPGA